MFKKPKKTEESVIEGQVTNPENTDANNGFSNDLKNYGPQKPKKKRQAALSKAQRTMITVVSCVLVVLLAFGATLLWSPSWYFANATAMTVNGIKVPVSEYNFNYWTTVQYFYQYYGSYLDSDTLDTTKDLAKQQCPSSFTTDEDMTWQDYFIDQTDDYVETIMVAYQKAVEMGFTLTESDLQGIDSFFEDTIATNAQDNGVSDEQFIHLMFGTSCNKENLRTALEHIYIADHYNDYLLNSYTVEQTELDDWMAEYNDQFWGACYNYYGFEAASDSETDVGAAKKLAHDFLDQVTDQASFADLAYETAAEADKSSYESETATLRYYFTADEINDADISNWLFDESRQPGDKEVIYSVTDGTAYAIYFVDANYPPTLATNLYSIYFGIGDKYATQSEAQAAAQAVQAKFIEGGKTAELFKTLAAEYSDDAAAEEDGGYIENFLPKDMDQDVAIWCYTTGRNAGEYSIIESSYGGYYFIYLDSWGDFVWRVTAIEDIQNYHYALTQDETFSNIQSEAFPIREYMVSK
ncbi:MAG TPA: peptidylprolyl isomerase [Oscillospiraceae bacterium]|nr:peptidylprolyl isomerase [Oscillospiraceae bacterium]HPF55942.1 peptidylprolyl isomerase [Clostridiales bacterium]HPK36159.1 peptidylprolyl isomerase [Oscillospiraceae bacterium]HPR76537.1 peptidylprolyl isomerase [Oscillospiraceae bacterium]